MPRGFQVDHNATRERFGYDWRPGRSFVSKPKIIEGECTEPKPHLVLYGLDKGPIRAEIFRRNRQQNQSINCCVKCNRIVVEFLDDYGTHLGFQVGEWNHIRHKAGERCDCPENGEVVCPKCHPKEHPQVRFGESKVSQES